MPKRRPPFVTDEISELDWLWFTQNPKVRERIRRPYPREIEKYGDTDICVYKQSSRCMYRYPVIFGLKED